ncbi:MAG: CTP synthetase [Rhodobacteraceae bacterium]|nr:MAG: CTP synthetase [Paracoccaceae bacterium]
MLPLTLILHIFIGSTLAGSAVIAALVTGYDTLQPILIAAAVGFVISIPLSWYVARLIMTSKR